MHASRLSRAIGADISGVAVRDGVSADAFRPIRRAWLDHHVLRFRDQALSDRALVAFSRRFGDLDVAPPNENGRRDVPGHPEILVISNVVENGVEIGSLGAGEAVWHTDMSYLAEPPDASLLYALEVPAEGGDTGFVNMHRALAAMPDALRSRIEGLTIKHDASTNSAGYLRQGSAPVTDAAHSPGTVHPIIRSHPESGREALFLGRRRNAYIPGLSLRRSEALLDQVWAHATRDEFVWYQTWRAGDLLVWDNRCVMHRRDAFDPRGRRVMHRTQVKGSRPYSRRPPDEAVPDTARP